MAKAKNTDAEYIYSETYQQPADLIAALDGAAKKGTGTYNGRPLRRTECEAGIVSRNGGQEVLCTRWHPEWCGPTREHRRAQARWKGAVALDRKRYGKHDFIEARPYLAELTNPMLAALEDAYGRLGQADNLYAYRDDADAERIELAAVERQHSPRITFLYVRHGGLWHPAGRWDSAPRIDVPQKPANHPKVAIV